MSLSVVEIFSTLQGEGSKAGTPAVFVRFAGCNLWSGKEESRGNGRGHCAKWCDTDFVKGDRYTPASLADHVRYVAQHGGISRSRGWLLVLTGGEPLLQLRSADGLAFLELMEECTLAVETNGTVLISRELSGLLDHVTVSPKPLKNDADNVEHILVRAGTDLKVVVPGGWSENAVTRMHAWSFKNRFVQPCDLADNGKQNLPEACALAASLGWRVSVQVHKMLGLR